MVEERDKVLEQKTTQSPLVTERSVQGLGVEQLQRTSAQGIAGGGGGGGHHRQDAAEDCALVPVGKILPTLSSLKLFLWDYLIIGRESPMICTMPLMYLKVGATWSRNLGCRARVTTRKAAPSEGRH